jgi:regulator of protease activity HflC (stomatin/prohibitin superfamily)
VAVGAAYEKYVGAKQKREADILRARAQAIRTNALASAEVSRRKLQASAESIRKIAAAEASETLFTNQMAAFQASPEVYSQRAYLQTLARHGGGARKFVLAVTNSQEVLLLNMEDKLRDDLLNVPLPPPKR